MTVQPNAPQIAETNLPTMHKVAIWTYTAPTRLSEVPYALDVSALLSKKEVKTLHFQCSLFQILKIFCIFAAWQITETGHIVLVI